MNDTAREVNSNDITFLIMSCDAYSDLWEPFFSCFFKYWPDCPFPIVLTSNYKSYPDERIKTINFGEDRDYSSNLIQILDQINTQWLILWFEDVFLSQKVSTTKVLSFIHEARLNNANYLKLSIDGPWYINRGTKQLIGPIPKGVRYRGAVGMALYSKSLLMKLLVPGESAWILDKSNRSDAIDESFFALSGMALKSPPFVYEHAVAKGKWIYMAPAFLRREGLDRYIKNRKVQSVWTYLYIKLFWYRLILMRMLGMYWY